MIDIIINALGGRVLLCACVALLVISIGLGVTVKIQSAQLDAAKARQESLGDKLASQNRAVATWRAEADRQVIAAKAAVKRSRKVRTVTLERIRTITVAAIPPSCPDAIVWGAEHALEFHKRWTQETGLKEIQP